MDVKDLARKIESEYELAMKYDKNIASLYNKVSAGTATYQEAGKFASMSGEHIGNVIAKNIDDMAEITLEDAMELIPPALRKNHGYVADVTHRVQEVLNEKAGIGLKPLDVGMDVDRANEIAREVADGISKEQLLKECENFSRKTVDKYAQRNAAAQSSAGLVVLVTREYDDVGVHNGKDMCQWCLDRCGSDMTYSEAYSIGAFERHPGCGCIITYTSRKGVTTRQSRAGGNWEEVSQQDISTRKRHGL